MHVSYLRFRNNFSTDPHPPGADKSPITLDGKDELKDENVLDDLQPTSIIKYANSEITIEENNISSHEEHKQNNVTIHIFYYTFFDFISHHILSIGRSLTLHHFIVPG